MKRAVTGKTWLMSAAHVARWFCPGCGKEVEEPNYISAEEGQDATGSSASGEPEISWGAPVRFHVGHFHKRIGRLYYRTKQSWKKRPTAT